MLEPEKSYKKSKEKTKISTENTHTPNKKGSTLYMVYSKIWIDKILSEMALLTIIFFMFLLQLNKGYLFKILG